jgi:iron complex outermembrane recepter protein
MKQIVRALCGLAAILIANASPAAENPAISLRPGTLGNAIVELGQQTGSTIGMSDQVLARLPVSGVRGRMPVSKALRRLIRDLPIRAIRISATSWRLVRRPQPLKPLAVPPRPTPSPPRHQPPMNVEHDEAQDEIVVTASKRATKLRDFPGTIAIVQGSSFSAGIDNNNSNDLAEKLPFVSSTSLGTGRNKLFIRGIADSGFAGPTQATVGQYLGEMRINYNAPDPDLRLYDVNTVEVLEGPQGTLYGAGSLGGIIKVNANQPDPGITSARGSLSVAATAHGGESVDANAVMNVPILADRVGIRLVGYGSREAGYIDDTARGLKDVNRVAVYGGRLSASALLGEEWRIDVSGLVQIVRGEDAQYAQRSLDGLTRRSTIEQPFSTDYWLGSAQLRGAIGEIDVISSVGMVRHRMVENYDASRLRNAPTLFRQRNQISLFSSETRLSHQSADGGGWLVGTAFIQNESNIRRSLTPADMPVPQTGVENRLSEVSVFGEFTLPLSPALRITAGGRFSSASLSGTAIDAPANFDIAAARQDASRTETAFLPSVALLAQPGSKLTLFMRYQQGFRPGGLAVDGSNVRRFRNDRTSTVETGFRLGNPDHDDFALTATAAYTDWNNIQADLTDGRGFPTTANIGDGRIVSVEGQFSTRLSVGLQLDAAVIFSDSRLQSPSALVQSFLATANSQSPALSVRVPNVANVSGRLGARYTRALGQDLDFSFSASARYTGKSRLGVGPVLGTEQGGFFNTLVGASIDGPGGSVFLSVNNLFDAVGNRFALGTPFALPLGDEYTPLRPRTVSLGFRFGF